MDEKDDIAEEKNSPADDDRLLENAALEFFKELGIPADIIGPEVFAFRRELSRESDRGAALYAAAHLDDLLHGLLHEFLVDDPGVFKRLFSGTGGLATFSARTTLAYLLGLIPISVRDDLNLIRKIRNDFAHSSRVVSFGDAPIASRCLELKRVPLARAPRLRFVQAVMSCSGVLEGTTRSLRDGKMQRRTVARDAPPVSAETVIQSLELIAESRVRQVPVEPPIKK
jgi:DNA-binding MltR family transcriptional regulator